MPRHRSSIGPRKFRSLRSLQFPRFLPSSERCRGAASVPPRTISLQELSAGAITQIKRLPMNGSLFTFDVIRD